MLEIKLDFQAQSCSTAAQILAGCAFNLHDQYDALHCMILFPYHCTHIHSQVRQHVTVCAQRPDAGTLLRNVFM